MLALAVWSVYVLLNVLRLPDWSGWAITGSVFGILACVAVAAGFRYWRSTVLLASFVYLAFYASNIIRLAMLAGEVEDASLLSALSRHYATSWIMANGVFLERGAVQGSMHAFLEYVMPVLAVALIVATAMSRRVEAGK